MCDKYDDKQKKRLKIILLAPIEYDKTHINGFSFDSSRGIILSNQTYIPENSDRVKFDADMSDIAVCFYESLYNLESEKNKKGKILDGTRLFDNEFAGDTMNNHKFVARYASDEKAYEWASKYHCLANFWLLPNDVGRTNKSNGNLCKGRAIRPAKTVKNFNAKTKDYMDRFLDQLSDNKAEYEDKFKRYFSIFPIDDMSKFGNAHFLNDNYISNGVVVSFSRIDPDKTELKTEDVDSIIDSMDEKINERAKDIVNSSKGPVLYFAFKNLCDSIPEEMLKTE